MLIRRGTAWSASQCTAVLGPLVLPQKIYAALACRLCRQLSSINHVKQSDPRGQPTNWRTPHPLRILATRLPARSHRLAATSATRHIVWETRLVMWPRSLFLNSIPDEPTLWLYRGGGGAR